MKEKGEGEWEGEGGQYPLRPIGHAPIELKKVPATQSVQADAPAEAMHQEKPDSSLSHRLAARKIHYTSMMQ
jgi:hypothetical protein